MLDEIGFIIVMTLFVVGMAQLAVLSAILSLVEWWEERDAK